MNRILKILAAKVFCLTLLLPGTSFGAGIPVVDGSNLSQNTISAFESVVQTLKQVEEYALQMNQYAMQLQQLEDQIRNTAAPAMYVWAEAQSYMNKIQALQNKVDTLMASGSSGFENYMMTFGDPNYYGNTQYFKDTDAKMTKFQEQERAGMDLQRQAIMDVLLPENQAAMREQLKRDADELNRLQSTASGATGRMQAIQYGNQFASHANSQLLQLRAALQTQQAMLASDLQLQRDREARDKAMSDTLRSGTWTKF